MCYSVPKQLHKGFCAAFCHLPDHYRNRRDTPPVNAEIAFPQLQTPAGDGILPVRWLDITM